MILGHSRLKQAALYAGEFTFTHKAKYGSRDRLDPNFKSNLC